MQIAGELCCDVGAASWIAMFVLKRPERVMLGNYVLIVFHLVLLPVVSALSASEWIRAAGYFWIFLDTALGVAEINGLNDGDVWALRMGSHLPAGIWIIGSSLGMRGFSSAVGLVLGLILSLHALIAPKIPKWALLPSVPLMVIWLLMVARQLR
jgi:hypothetical protein